MLTELRSIENHKRDENGSEHGHHGDTGKEAFTPHAPFAEFATIVSGLAELEVYISEDEGQMMRGRRGKIVPIGIASWEERGRSHSY